MKPKILIKIYNQNRCIEGIDFIELPKIPYDFRRLKSLLSQNYQEYSNFISILAQSGCYSQEEINDFKTILETVKELNKTYFTIS